MRDNYGEWMRVQEGVEGRRVGGLEFGLGKKSEIVRRELTRTEGSTDEVRVGRGKEEVEKGSKKDKLVQEIGKGEQRTVEKGREVKGRGRKGSTRGALREESEVKKLKN